ncbi:hypothetical protein BCR36DRAFT_374259 [Piromyces finnis]|uniref:Uncharacterized protein n=1 Tax=Piromyces finnis TaxID=1754191 RepID=A0A1Y1UYL7_9FUNG|nr:hypothetical protein BCR36DRAFT_374259 [Piromyces finnis]|eukprot:ORX42862.1 hypothetical protein BCR36DRAFT_374259 [Piromyces finnis]
MINLINRFFYIILVFSFYVIVTYGKEYIIRNGDDFFYSINGIITNYEGNEELIFRFPDHQYDMLNQIYSISIPVNTNISFIGNENMTIFDFGFDKKGALDINKSIDKELYVKFENIIIQNFYSLNQYQSKISVFHVISQLNNLFVTYNNCIFRNNSNDIFTLDINCSKNNIIEPNVTFNNCKFL